MFEKTKKKLIHFNTSGNIAEDFLASQRKKSASFRMIIRFCFFFHIIAGIACLGLGYALGAEFVSIAVCAGIDIVIAFFAAGGEMTTKGSLVGIDVILAAAGITAGFLNAGFNEKIVYFSCGGIMAAAAIWAAAELIAAYLRNYLMNFQAENLCEDDYTLIKTKKSGTSDSELNLNGTCESCENASDLQPPKKSEMFELAEKLSEILNTVPEKEDFVLNSAAEIEIDSHEKFEQ